METTTPFDLNRAIRHWRENLTQTPALRGENLDELEAHLRDSVASLQSRSLSVEEAFSIGVRRLGGCDQLEQEFAKVNTGAIWHARLCWMLAGMLILLVGTDLAGAVSSALVFLGSLTGTNGFSLGWFGVAGKCAVLVFGLWLLRSVAAGGLDRVSGNIQRLFHCPTLAVVMLLIATLALKLATTGFTAASAQRLPSISLSQAHMIIGFGNFVGQFLVLVFLIVHFSRFFLQRRISGGIGTMLLAVIIPLAIHGTVAHAQTQPPSAGNSNQAEKQNRNTLDQVMTLWRAGKKDEAAKKFVAVDMSERPLFPAGSVLNYSEKQFVALPQAVRDKLSKEMLADVQIIKEICAHVREASKNAASGGDQAKAEKGFAHLKKCGEAFDRPDALALLQVVGKGLKKTAAAQSSKPNN